MAIKLYYTIKEYTYLTVTVRATEDLTHFKVGSPLSSPLDVDL